MITYLPKRRTSNNYYIWYSMSVVVTDDIDRCRTAARVLIRSKEPKPV